MNQYQIHPFHVHSNGERTILVSGRAVVRLVNEAFCRLLQRMRDEGSVLWTEEELAQQIARVELPYEATRGFLLDNGVLRHVGIADERVSVVRIGCVSQAWRDLVSSGIDGVPVQACASFDAAEASAARHELWVLLMERYSEARIVDFHSRLRCAPNASGVLAYFRFRTLCVSSVYSPAYGTPCHLCHVGWESRVKARSGPGAATVSSLMRAFEANGDHELPPPALRTLDLPTASAFLRAHIEQLAGVGTPKLLQEEITLQHEFDLQTFTRRSNVAVHWPGCDCQYQSQPGSRP